MPASNQRQVCWEKIVEANPLFRLTFPYASKILSEQIIAVHALFACLDQLVVQSTDDYVARTKLEWWRRETLKENIKRSRHPVIAYLEESGASAALHNGALQKLLDATECRLEAKAPADLVEFISLCSELYQPRIEIEYYLVSSKVISAARQQLMAVNGGLILLLQDTFIHQQGRDRALWWVPLRLLARSEMSRAVLMQTLGSKPARSIFGEILSCRISVSATSSRHELSPTEELNAHSHLLLQEYLHSRQLARLQKSTPVSFGEELTRLYLRDVFALWNKAREIKAADSSSCS